MKSIRISIPDQMLVLAEDGKALKRYLVSTSKNGAGEKCGSFCTPRGRHVIRAKVGAGEPVNTVFVKRRPTGEIYDAELGSRFPGRDWMLTRLLWLSGSEPGFNRLGVDRITPTGRSVVHCSAIE
jgi:L,D-transpeptidase YbiS